MKNCMELNIKCLYYAGFWPSRNDSTKRGALHALAVSHLARIVYSTVVQVYNEYLVWGDLDRLVEHMIFVVADIKIFLYMHTLIYRHGDIAAMVGYLKEKQALHGEAQDPEQRRIVSLVNRLSHYITVLITAVMMISLINVAITLTWYGLEHREIPFRKWFPIDVSYTPIFEITLFVLMTTQTYHMLVVAYLAILCIAINIQMIGQFVLLNHKLANMHALVAAETHRSRAAERVARLPKLTVEAQTVETTTDNENISPTQKEFSTLSKGVNEHDEHSLATISVDTALETAEFLKSCVVHQIELIGHCEVLGSVLQMSFMTQVASNGLTCLAMIYITDFSGDVNAKVAAAGGLIFAAVLEFAIFCTLGTALLEYSCRVALSAYSCDWFGMSKAVKKSLQIVMAKAMKGITFSAVGIFPVTVDSFVAVLKFSYSTYAVLKSVSASH